MIWLGLLRPRGPGSGGRWAERLNPLERLGAGGLTRVLILHTESFTLFCRALECTTAECTLSWGSPWDGGWETSIIEKDSFGERSAGEEA